MSQSETKPFDYIIHNVNIATLSDQYASEDNPYGVIENGAVGVNDGLISYIGTSNPELDAKEAIDAQGQWLTKRSPKPVAVLFQV